MNTKRTLSLFLFFSCFILTVGAQKVYKVTLRLQGLEDSLLVMASYVGDKQFVVDTAYADKSKNFIFKGDSLLPEGMYTIAGSNKIKLFDIILSGNQKVEITGSLDKSPPVLQSALDDENRILFNYIEFLSAKQKKLADLQRLTKKYAVGSDSLEIIKKQIEILNEEVKREISVIIKNNQGSFIALFLKSLQEPEIPIAPILANGRPDSLFTYREFRNRFWQNIDLSDPRTIRTPVIHNKVDLYINKLTPQSPDSINKAIDKLFVLIKDNKEAFKYLIWYLTIKYESSEIMGHDAVFVHLVDKYYSDPKMSWMNPTVKENLVKKANTLRPILLGKVTPELILLDTLHRPVSLHAIKSKFTLIYFWDPDCGHCKKETPLLKKFYDEFSKEYNFQVYGVCMDTSWKNMKEYITLNQLNWINVNGYYSVTPDFRELYDVHGSPVLYLLDEQKKIIAKRVLTDQMKSIIESLSNN